MRALEAFLLGGNTLPEPALLRESTLEGYAFGHRGKATPDLKIAHTTAVVRHMRIKAALLPLVRAWQDAGVEPLVFKGFYLAEFVYGSPGDRHYADIDILMDPARSRKAAEIAQSLGWTLTWHADDPNTMFSPRLPGYLGHEVMQLENEALDVTIDVHRRLVHNNHNRLPPRRRHVRLTEAAWERSKVEPFGSTRIRVLQPVDSVLFGLVLNRCWSSDRWRLKPRDFADLSALVARFSISRHDLEARAKELGCERTLALYLRRCDPFTPHLDLSAPPSRKRLAWNALVALERGPRDVERLAMSIVEFPRNVLEIAALLPVVARASRAVRNGLVAEDPPRPSATSANAISYWEWRGIRRGVRRSVRILRIPASQREATSLEAIRLALAARGVHARTERQPGGTATLTVDGRPLELGSGTT